MRDTIRFILANRCADRLTIITFYGGESLLALGKIKWMMKELRAVLGIGVGFSISTNGYALTPKVIDWLVSVSDCHVYITIDGYRDLHDQNRRTAGGLPTYDKILANLRYFKTAYPEEYQARVGYLVTLSRWSQLPEVSERWRTDSFFGDKIPKHLSFLLPSNLSEMQNPASPIEERRKVMWIAFERYKYGEKSLLTQMFDELTASMLRNMLTAQSGKDVVVTTCLEDMYRTFVSAEGDVYICERFGSGHAVGSVADGKLDRARVERMEADFINRRNQRCSHCSAAVSCRICMTAANYTDMELDALCTTERMMIDLLKEFAWQRRMFDRRKQLT